jgi:hypothetical protein
MPLGLSSSINSHDLGYMLDTQLGVRELMMPAEPTHVAKEISFDDTFEFWRDAYADRLRATRTVVLRNVFLSEWFPRSPGLYDSESAKRARDDAMQYQLSPSLRSSLERSRAYGLDGITLYDPYGKMAMLEGGIGCLRLVKKPTHEGYMWFMSASSTLRAEQGVPLGVPDELYERHIEYLEEAGLLPCTVVGTLRLIPERLTALYRHYSGVPRLYVQVEELRATSQQLSGTPVVGAAVLCRAPLRGHAEIVATYADFVPGRHGKQGNVGLQDGVMFLEDYIDHVLEGEVIVDFDEQMPRFSKAEFSLSKVSNGQLEEEGVSRFADAFDLSDERIKDLMQDQRQFNLVVREMTVTGDFFSNIGAGAVIVNRSTLTNALNKYESEAPEVSEALKQLAKAVADSGNVDAAENLNELTDEISKPQPSKNKVRVWLDALSAGLPAVAAVGTAVATLASLLL